MIRGAMAVAASGRIGIERAGYAHDARIVRVLALVVDSLLSSLIAYVVNTVYGVTMVTASSPIPPTGGGMAFHSSEATVGWFWLAIVGLLYFTIPEAMFGATPGKLWYRLRVVRLDGRPLGLRDVLIRNLLRLIDALPVLYMLGGASVFATRGSQRLGDLAAGTTVVYRHRAAEPGATRRASRAAVRALAMSLAAALTFTIAFAYFGRPPLVIAGLYNTHQLLQPDVTSYTIGAAEWGFGEVTYPITIQRSSTTCTGSLTLHWNGRSWQLAGSTYTCAPVR
jgi:uncharacterized RDD family membrane protein YckC